MKLNKLTIQDKKLFNKYLSLASHELSPFAFENICIWKPLFGIFWTLIDGRLCVFFKDSAGYFLYLPPLGRNKNKKTTKTIFKLLNKLNKGSSVTRIENVEQKDAAFYRKLGYELTEKPCDYVCLRSDLINLKGNRYKSKRRCVNYFTKNNQFEYLPFSSKHKKECLQLYARWMKKRKAGNEDFLYQRLLEDNYKALGALLSSHRQLDYTGRVVKIGKHIKAFTFGFKLNSNTFCIEYEIADLSLTGLSQFIFQKFCSELKEYKYINIMDDSGLDNLKRVKLSYHPVKQVKAYIALEK